MKKLMLGLSLGVAWGLAGTASADDATRMCLMKARDAFQQCRTTCTNDFKVAVSVCRNVDPACAETCRGGLEECRAPILQGLEDCLGVCKPPLESAKSDCKAQCGCGGASGHPCGFDPCFIGCVNPAETTAFQCRDACRDAFQLNSTAQAALKACQDQFKACIKACPPPPPPPQ